MLPFPCHSGACSPIGEFENLNRWRDKTMSWSDALKGVVGNIVGEAEQAALPDLLKGVLGNEGLQTILAKLQSAGFGAQVQSWFDKNKSNLPISPDEIKTALGDEHVQQLARSLGIPVDAILAALAEKLPEIANTAGPAANPAAPANAGAIPDPKAP
jgi:uncharacterized protein YidB (DUF937 family)